MRSRRSISPRKERGTLCISSQVGCTLTCSFCHTGTQKLVRNLTAGEIVGQVMLARDDLDEWPAAGRAQGRDAACLERRADGHGRAALQLRERPRRDEGGDGQRRHRPSAAAASRCRPAASCPRSPAPPTEIGCLLAVSFHATTDEVRDRSCRSTRRWNIATLLDALRDYPRLSNSERITFEYVMLKGVNDSEEDAKRLVEADRGHPGQDQPDPLQRMARRALRAVGLGAGSRPLPTSSTRPAMQARSAPRAARISWRPVAS